MRYLVTGATGFIGGRVTRQLRESGHEVITLARNPDKASELRTLGVEIHMGDITDKASLTAPMTGVDGVFHIAAWYEIGARNRSMAERINVNGTRNVLETMRDLNIAKGVYTSSLAVFSNTRGQRPDEGYVYRGAHLSEYDRTKWLAHYEVAQPMIDAGLPLVIVQPGLTYGIGDHSLTRDTLIQYLRRRLPMIPQDTGYCWAHVDDIARGHILAMERGAPGKRYIIAGDCHTLADVLQIAERMTGIPAPKLRAAPGMLRAMSGLMNIVGKIAPVPPLYDAETLRVTAGVTYYGENAKAKRELGYQPRALEEGLREVLAHEMRLLGLQAPTTQA